MWGASGLIVIIIIDSVASFQLQCVLNYLSEEEDEVGIVVYLGEGSENVDIFEDLVNGSRVTWTVINRHANFKNITGTPANYLVIAQGLDPVRITKKALRRLSTFERLWEPSARMIVLLGPLQLFGSPQTSWTYETLASRIISSMWKYSVFDAVVMFLVDDVKDGLRLYSANPFAAENQCGRVAEKLMDLGCDGEAMYFEAERNVWKHPDEVHHYYQNFTRNGIDLAIGGTIMNNKHIYKVEYLKPHAQVSLVYYVANAGNMKGWDTLHTMFTAAVWYILGVSLLLGGISYSIVVEGRFNIKRTKFLQLLAILVTQTMVLPKRWRIRIFLVVFLLPLYHISSLHSTALQSYMVHTPKEKPITTENELRALNMTVYMSASTRELILESKTHENMRISYERLFDRLATLNKEKNYSILARSLEVDMFRGLGQWSDEKGQYKSIGWKGPVGEWVECALGPQTSSGRPIAAQKLMDLNIHPIRPAISTFAVSLTMGKGSLYRDVVDNLTQRCLEVGLFEKWVTDLTRIQSIRPKQVLYDSTALEPLDLEDLECAFLLLFAGLAISTGVFLGGGKLA